MRRRGPCKSHDRTDALVRVFADGTEVEGVHRDGERGPGNGDGDFWITGAGEGEHAIADRLGAGNGRVEPLHIDTVADDEFAPGVDDGSRTTDAALTVRLDTVEVDLPEGLDVEDVGQCDGTRLVIEPDNMPWW